jgi:histidinol dehydrogenase
MCAIPAKVAGVNRIALCSPAPVAKQILVAAKICGITEVYAVGGAQAIAAMAYGTKTVRKVDKIVGPGNQYVTEAKKQVRGMGVDIDMLAGPTEVFIVADDLAKADFVAADMLAQLEHGPDSAAIVIATKKKAGEIAKELEGQLAALPRRDIAEASLKNSALLTSDFADLQAIADAVNTYAPEHLELQTTRNAAILELIQNAGAIFIGEQSCEAFGDYCTGSNHVLPTGGSAKFASGLSVDAFVKRIEVVEVTESRELVKNTEILARGEELEGHARSAGKRRGR